MKVVSATVNLPRNLWQCLVVMAAQDVREPENFVSWLVSREAQRRGLLPADAAGVQAESQPVEVPHETQSA